MAAAHPWDICGAMAVGLQGAYIQRSAVEPYPPFLPAQPQLQVASLEDLAAQLAAGRGGLNMVTLATFCGSLLHSGGQRAPCIQPA